MTGDTDRVWLCIERHSDGEGGPGVPAITNMPGGPAHCYFTGIGPGGGQRDHLPDCGYRWLFATETEIHNAAMAIHTAEQAGHLEDTR